jgi:hypothetical protein
MAPRFAIKFLIYLLCLASIFFGLNKLAVYKDKDDGSAKKWHELFYNEIQADVIIIGASHAASGINPAYLEYDNFRAFNFAIHGNNPIATLKWYKQFFRKYYTKPKAIIYEVNWFLFDSDWLGFHIENASHHFPSHVYMKELVNRNNDREMLILNRYPVFYNKLSDFFTNKNNQIISMESAYYHGFTPENGNYINPGKMKNESTRNFAEQQQAFNELLDLLISDGISITFVQAPEYLKGRNCDMIKTNNDYIRSVARAKNIRFINFNDDHVTAINYDQSLYTDWGHLNMNGSTQFSMILSEALKHQSQ